MTELIKVKNASYILYEELLLKKENLKKEGEQFYIAYLKLFGDLLAESIQKKIECIRKKKMIAFCQRCRNQGKPVRAHELNRAIAAEMAEYEEQLKQLSANIKAAEKSEHISEEEYRKIKEIYYRLARMIHPDMRRDLASDPIIRDYWNRAVIAYRHNRLVELEELDVLVQAYLEKNGSGDGNIDVADVEQKIAELEKEIERIVSGRPYSYRFEVENEVKQRQKKEELQDEIREYAQYLEELDQVLKTFEIKEMFA